MGAWGSRAFTLLELLVVLVILGIVVGMIVVRIDFNTHLQKLDEEARRFTQLVSLAREEAVLQSEELALEVEAEHYRFLVFDREKGWLPLQGDRLLRERQLEDGMRAELLVEGVPPAFQGKQQVPPRLFVLSSGELTPFELHLRYDDDPKSYTVKGDLTGELTIEGPPQ